MLKLIFPLETEDNFDDQPSEEDSNSEYLRIKTPGELNTEDSRNDIDRTDQENSNSEVVITPMKTENYFAQSEDTNELDEDGAIEESINIRVDPYDTNNLAKVMSKKSYAVYRASWIKFVKTRKISIDKPPQENDFLEYLLSLAEGGLGGSTIKSTYSHLNKFYKMLYRQGGLGQWPQLFKLVECFGSNSSKVSRWKKFTKEEMKIFLEADHSESRYWLLRKVVLILAYCGGTRLAALRNITRNSVCQTQEGFRVTFDSHTQSRKLSKKFNTVEKVTDFLIPFGPSDLGVDFGSIIEEYILALKEVGARHYPTDPFLFCGKDGEQMNDSKFINAPLGENALREIGKQVAIFLKLKNPELYTSLCFNPGFDSFINEESQDQDKFYTEEDTEDPLVHENDEQEPDYGEALVTESKVHLNLKTIKTEPNPIEEESNPLEEESNPLEDESNPLEDESNPLEDDPLDSMIDPFPSTSQTEKPSTASKIINDPNQANEITYNIDTRIDPYELDGMDQNMAPNTFNAYKTSWLEFIQSSGISIHVPPEEIHFKDFFVKKHQTGYKGNTIRVLYAHLNKLYQLLYKKKLDQWPRLHALIQSYTSSLRKFKQEEMKQFLVTASSSNRYWLVRKVVLILNYCEGKNRPTSLHYLRYNSVQACDQGFHVCFTHQLISNQDSISPGFIIPSGPSELGLNFAEIIKEYLQALIEDGIIITSESPFLFSAGKAYSGIGPTKFKRNTFVNAALSKNSLGKVGKEVADFLELDSPENYGGRCFNKQYFVSNSVEEDSNLLEDESNPFEEEADPSEDMSNDSMIDPFASTSQTGKPSIATKIIHDPHSANEIAHNNDTGIDPYKLDGIDQNMTSRTFKDYKASWLEFVKSSGISIHVTPEEIHFKDFFVKKHQNGYNGNTIRVLYVHLNKFYQLLYKKKLDQWPRLHALIQSYTSSLRKFKHFTTEEMKQFLWTADSSNRYWLVRKVVLILSYYGGNISTKSLRSLRYDSVQACDQGFNVNVSNEDSISLGFIIPSGLSELGPDIAEIIEEYLQALIEDGVSITSESPFLFSAGRGPIAQTSRTKFANYALGENLMRDIGKDVANFLRLDSPESYAGRCFSKQYFDEQIQSDEEQQNQVNTNGVGNLESALNSEEVQDHLQEYHENSEPIHQGLKQRREEKVNLKRTAAEDDPLMLERAEKECKVESYETLARYWQ